MINPIYNLPDIRFIGGESQVFLFTLLTPKGYDFDASDCTVKFAIINYSNKNGKPLLIKDAEILKGLNGIMNIASVELLPEDTVYLSGRFVYQLSIADAYDNTEIPGQGIVDVTRNIHQDFVTNL